MSTPESVDALEAALIAHDYVPDRSLSVAMFLALEMGRPLFLEGEPGVGKTEVAKVLTSILGGDLIRLQCYEGLDASHALYEWDYARQMLAIRLLEASGNEADVTDIMSDEYLVARPLLQAVRAAADGRPTVLLIDELDRADEEFEAYLLELLSDFQVTIPEIGTVKAETPPVVVITSNRTREIHDAVKRRCVYDWIDYPNVEREMAILAHRSPATSVSLAKQLAEAMQRLRDLDLFKPPGVAETIDWAKALEILDAQDLTAEISDETLGVVLKYRDDIDRVREHGVEAIV
jgi:MoxR-like ATPase